MGRCAGRRHEAKLFDAKTLKEVKSFLGKPLAWSKKNGGIDKLPFREE